MLERGQVTQVQFGHGPVDENVGKGAGYPGAVAQHALCCTDAVLAGDCVMYQQYVLVERCRMHLLKLAQEMEYGGLAGGRGHAEMPVDIVLVEGAAVEADHVVLLLGLLVVIGDESGIQTFGRGHPEQVRTHGVGRVRGYGGVQSGGSGFLHQLPGIGDDCRSVFRLGAEDLHECPGVHGPLALHGETLVAVGDIGHGADALGVEFLELPSHGFLALFRRR